MKPDALRRSAPLLILLLAQLAVGSAAIMARFGLSAGMTALSLSAWRLSLASLLLLFLRLRQTALPSGAVLTTAMRVRLLAAGGCLGLHFLTWFASLNYVSVARSTLLVTTSPLWAGLAGHFLMRERLARSFWFGLLLAAPGVYGVTYGAGETSVRLTIQGMTWWGDTLAVLGAVFFAAYLLLVQGVQAQIGTARTVAWTYTSAALSLWPATLWFSADAALPRSGVAWVSVAGMATLPQLIGHTAMNWALTRFPAGVVAAATLLEPVFAAILAWMVWNEAIGLGQAVGAGVLLLGVALALRQEKPVASDASPGA